jgi:altronate dehydratase small subunit
MTEFEKEQGPRFILLHDQDNTLTALMDLKQGEEIIVGSQPKSQRIAIRQDIRYAHKFARAFISRGSDVKKYGEVIGIATVDIHPGDHVHVHNVESKRAKGGPS